MLDTIFIDGSQIGYQFNMQSQGSRTVHRRVHNKAGNPYIYFGGNIVRVCPLHQSDSVFEATKIIGNLKGEL